MFLTGSTSLSPALWAGSFTFKAFYELNISIIQDVL
jgi:hypothetical protein